MTIKYNNQSFYSFEDLAEAIVENEPLKAQNVMFEHSSETFTVWEVYDMFYDDPDHQSWNRVVIDWLTDALRHEYEEQKHKIDFVKYGIYFQLI